MMDTDHIEKEKPSDYIWLCSKCGNECYPLQSDLAIVVVCETCGERFEVEQIGCDPNEDDPLEGDGDDF